MELPWSPEGFEQAFPVAVLSLVCWGSWGNTAKAAANIPFACYYFDYSVGALLMSGVGFTALGGMEFAAAANATRTNVTDAADFGPGMSAGTWSPPSALDSLRTVDTFKLVAAVGAGVIFNIANLLLVVAIQICGLSIAFPIGIGTALVLGTVLIYLIDQTGDPYLLFPGVALALVAVVCMSAAHAKLEAAREGKPSKVNGVDIEYDVVKYEYEDDIDSPLIGAKRPPTFSSTYKILICVASGVLMSLWGPLSTYSYASDEPGGLSVYGSFLLYSGAVVVTTPLLLVMQNSQCLIPRADSGTTLSELSRVPLLSHLWGLAGGFLWAVGTLSNIVSGKELGYALSYAIGQSAPLVATAWGVLYYREFVGCPWSSTMYLVLTVFFYVSAIAVVALSSVI